ncbi:MAG: phage integrase SAM-like domain-containing protein [Flavisolibacter sp.]
MPEIHFYIKKPERITKKSLIYLQMNYRGAMVGERHRFVFSTKYVIDPKDWNKKGERVKSRSIESKETIRWKNAVNAFLDELRDQCQIAYAEELETGIPAPATLKRRLIAFLDSKKPNQEKPTLFKLIQRFVDGEILTAKGTKQAVNTLKKYGTAQYHLQEFQKKHRYTVDFHTINLDFYYKYVSFLRSELTLKQNSIAKSVAILKQFMQQAVDLGYTNNMEFKNRKFVATWEETDAVYLNSSILQRLYEFDLSGRPGLERVRDLFIIGSHTGQRFGDYTSLKREHFMVQDGKTYIRRITEKTKDSVVIPCSGAVLELFKKYKGEFPKISNQKFNEMIKEVCKMAGESKKIPEMLEKGRLMTEPDAQLWETISSHTARRNFCSNLYLAGVPIIDIMAMSSHRTEKSFLKYIKISKLDKAKRVGEHIDAKWIKEPVMQAV